MEPKTIDRHLADAELFNLAVPARGRARGAAAASLRVFELQPRSAGMEERGAGACRRRDRGAGPALSRAVGGAGGEDDRGHETRRPCPARTRGQMGRLDCGVAAAGGFPDPGPQDGAGRCQAAPRRTWRRSRRRTRETTCCCATWRGSRREKTTVPGAPSLRSPQAPRRNNCEENLVGRRLHRARGSRPRARGPRCRDARREMVEKPARDGRTGSDPGANQTRSKRSSCARARS